MIRPADTSANVRDLSFCLSYCHYSYPTSFSCYFLGALLYRGCQILAVDCLSFFRDQVINYGYIAIGMKELSLSEVDSNLWGYLLRSSIDARFRSVHDEGTGMHCLVETDNYTQFAKTSRSGSCPP
jgi:hypothetical protein